MCLYCCSTFDSDSDMQIFDALTDEPLPKTLRLAAGSNSERQPLFKHLEDLLNFLAAEAPDARLYGHLLSQSPPSLLMTGPNKSSLKLTSDSFDGSQKAGES